MSRKSPKQFFTLANILTLFRLFGTGVLVFLQPLSIPFYILYTLCGLSDALDGPIARHSKTADEFGSKLDSIADLTFYWVIMLRILPILIELLPMWIWRYLNVVILLRILTYATAAVKFHRFASLHTWLNKVSGGGVFIIPYVIHTRLFTGYCILLCTIAFAAAVEELILHLQAKSYNPERKSVFAPREK